MTPKQVKDLLRQAVDNDDLMMAWPGVKELINRDMYINVAKPRPAGQGRFVVARWGDRPCRCQDSGCGKMIRPGDKVWWEPNWGAILPEHMYG